MGLAGFRQRQTGFRCVQPKSSCFVFQSGDWQLTWQPTHQPAESHSVRVEQRRVRGNMRLPHRQVQRAPGGAAVRLLLQSRMRQAGTTRSHTLVCLCGNRTAANTHTQTTAAAEQNNVFLFFLLVWSSLKRTCCLVKVVNNL